jgi:predicted porin
MQKKLLATAVAAALVAPLAAQADVTVYGLAQAEWAQISFDSATYTSFAMSGTGNSDYTFGTGGTSMNNPGSLLAGKTKSNIIDNAPSRFGIKATEDLGNGLTGIAVFELGLDIADGGAGTGTTSAPFSSRKMYVGLDMKGVGALLVGRDATPYQTSGTALDPLVGTTLEARNNYGMSGHRDGWGVLNAHNSFVNGIFFNSASWAGAYVNLYAGANHNESAAGTQDCSAGYNCTGVGAAGSSTAGDISAVAGWKGEAGGMGMHFFAGYAANGAATAMEDSPTAIKLGGQLTFAKAHTVSLQFEQTERPTIGWTGDADEATYLFLGYKGDFGPVTAVVQGGMFETGTTGATWGYEASYMAVGAIYNMSKTFRVFGGYRETTVEGSGTGWLNPIREDSVISLGLRKNF